VPAAHPKGSIYHLFPGGKTQIACEALQLYSEAVLGFMDEALPARGSPKARLLALFEAYAKRMEEGECRRSCAAGAVCTDLDDDLEPVRAQVEAVFGRWIKHLAGRFDFIADRRRAHSFARFVLSSIEGKPSPYQRQALCLLQPGHMLCPYRTILLEPYRR